MYATDELNPIHWLMSSRCAMLSAYYFCVVKSLVVVKWYSIHNKMYCNYRFVTFFKPPLHIQFYNPVPSKELKYLLRSSRISSKKYPVKNTMPWIIDCHILTKITLNIGRTSLILNGSWKNLLVHLCRNCRMFIMCWDFWEGNLNFFFVRNDIAFVI